MDTLDFAMVVGLVAGFLGLWFFLRRKDPTILTDHREE